MKTIIFYIKDHLKKDFHPLSYGITAFFLVIAFYINYHFDFEGNYLGKSYGEVSGYIYFILFYAFAYYMIAVPKLIISKKQSVFLNYRFWLKSFTFISLIGIAGAFYSYDFLIEQCKDAFDMFYLKKILVNSKRAFIYLIPLIIIKLIFDKKIPGIYGLKIKNLNIKPYFFMLALMIPLIALASTQSDFLDVYPKYKPWVIAPAFNLSKFQMVMIYEFFYGIDFVFVELIFRGALIIGMVRLIGKDAILPMVSAYAFLHFGKPLGEAISSVFGGYILGIIALYSKNIIGGSIIHMGIAYLMEIFALGQYYLLKGNS